MILDELARFRAAGGRSLVDLTLPGVGRDPAWLRGLAESSGLNLVMGCGWYRTAYYPPEALIDRRSADDLADELIAEIESGVGDSGVRPGIIGEIGTDKPWVSPAEERVHRAAARAARRTGLAITTHAVLSDVGLAQLRIFEEEGADPGRVVIGHADSYPNLDHYLAIIERGASIEFDFLGMSFSAVERHGESRVVELLCELLARGHADRILLSQDVCHDSQLKRYEGNGYVYLAELFLPRLRGSRRLGRRDRDDDGREPATAPDDRVDRREPPRMVLSNRGRVVQDGGVESPAPVAAVLADPPATMTRPSRIKPPGA